MTTNQEVSEEVETTIKMVAYDLSEVKLPSDGTIRILFGDRRASEAYAELLEAYDVPYKRVDKTKIQMTRGDYDTFLIRNQFRSLSGQQSW